MARLQCEQLQGHMAHLLEETREGATLAMVAAGAAGPGLGTGPGPGPGPGEAAAVAGAAVLVVEGTWAADDLLEDTRPGEP